MSKGKILVIEDDRALADVLAYNFKQAGYEVYLAHDGLDGLNQARLRLPEIVILDLMLPVVEGHDVCRRLRADPAMRDMHIIMLTAKSEESDEPDTGKVVKTEFVPIPKHYARGALTAEVKSGSNVHDFALTNPRIRNHVEGLGCARAF